jgi:hypothetical protein
VTSLWFLSADNIRSSVAGPALLLRSGRRPNHFLHSKNSMTNGADAPAEQGALCQAHRGRAFSDHARDLDDYGRRRAMRAARRARLSDSTERDERALLTEGGADAVLSRREAEPPLGRAGNECPEYRPRQQLHHELRPVVRDVHGKDDQVARDMRCEQSLPGQK